MKRELEQLQNRLKVRVMIPCGLDQAETSRPWVRSPL